MIDILVMTCEKYSHLVFKWLTFFKRTWTLPYQLTVVVAGPPKRLVIPSQTQGENIVYYSMPDKGFAANLLDFLSDKTEPFLMMMDDFMLFEVDNELIKTALGIITFDMNKVGCVRLVPWPGPTLPYSDSFGEIDKSMEYALSLQASFWKPQTFRDLLDPAWSPWQIELEGSKRAANYPKRFIGCKTCALNYKDYMMRGKPRPQHAEWVDKNL